MKTKNLAGDMDEETEILKALTMRSESLDFIKQALDEYAKEVSGTKEDDATFASKLKTLMESRFRLSGDMAELAIAKARFGVVNNQFLDP